MRGTGRQQSGRIVVKGQFPTLVAYVNHPWFGKYGAPAGRDRAAQKVQATPGTAPPGLATGSSRATVQPSRTTNHRKSPASARSRYYVKYAAGLSRESDNNGRFPRNIANNVTFSAIFGPTQAQTPRTAPLRAAIGPTSASSGHVLALLVDLDGQTWPFVARIRPNLSQKLTEMSRQRPPRMPTSAPPVPQHALNHRLPSGSPGHRRTIQARFLANNARRKSARTVEGRFLAPFSAKNRHGLNGGTPRLGRRFRTPVLILPERTIALYCPVRCLIFPFPMLYTNADLSCTGGMLQPLEMACLEADHDHLRAGRRRGRILLSSIERLCFTAWTFVLGWPLVF
jgi:hypothetical protein